MHAKIEVRGDADRLAVGCSARGACKEGDSRLCAVLSRPYQTFPHVTDLPCTFRCFRHNIPALLYRRCTFQLLHCRHAAELRAAGADKLCIVNSEAGLNLGAQLLSDLGSSETSVSLLRRGINEALAVRTAADNSRRDAAAAETQASAAQNGASSNGSSSNDKKKMPKRQVELFVLDGKHAYGLRAEALARAVSPDLPCTDCPLVKQQQEIAALSSLDESLIPGLLSSSSSTVGSVASVADVDGAAAAAVPAAGLNGSKSAAAAAVNASVGSNAAGGPGAGSV
jgi:hypothetical protein